ncbi:MAG: hypothetical protein KKA64_00200 [Nanoarchaeota archaeon]|nr:hypothetical protein [Nanoarchaeota archaeon]
MRKEDVSFLNQLARSMEETALNLERFYKKEDVMNMNKSKRLILQLQRKISEVLS